MADKPSLASGFDLPFQEQVDFFRAKLTLGTRRWDDIMHEAHDRAFVVAGAMKADLLADLRRAVDRAITKGTSLEAFREDFRQIVFNRGWTGWTGEGSQAGFNWRTKVIWETNLRASYAAGRWAQLNDPGLKKLMPYWRYVHADSVMSPRPQHLAWGQSRLTLPSDHPFWKTHFPPNGWGCRCRVTAVAAPKPGDATEPPAGWGEPGDDGKLPGVDKGWGYAPGASNTDDLKKLIQSKVKALPPEIGRAMTDDVAPPALAPAAKAVPSNLTVERGRFEWEVRDGDKVLAKYPASLPKKQVLAKYEEDLAAAAAKKAARSTTAKDAAARKAAEREALATLGRVKAEYREVIDTAHHNRNLEFQPLPMEAFDAKDTIPVHQSASFGKKAGSAYRIVMVDGRPAYARASDHWGKFNTVERGTLRENANIQPGDTFDETSTGTEHWKAHDWQVPGSEQTGYGKNKRIAGYIYLDDLAALKKSGS